MSEIPADLRYSKDHLWIRHTSHNNRPASGAGCLRRSGLGRRPMSAGRPCPGFPRSRPLRLPSCSEMSLVRASLTILRRVMVVDPRSS
jgi:hypothetical protein